MQLPDNIANERKIKKKHKNIPKPDEIKPVNKCYGYIRVSTNQQKDEGLSLENQKRRIEGWAMMSEYELVNIFADEGVSGKTVEKRKALKQLLSTIRTNNITSGTNEEAKTIAVRYIEASVTNVDFTTAVNTIATKLKAGKTYTVDPSNDSASKDESDIGSKTDAEIANDPAGYYKSGFLRCIVITLN